MGEHGLQKIIDARAADQIRAYRRFIPTKGSLKKRLDALARQRTAEGYMAEVKRDGRDGYLLIEHNCPICDAARCCLGLCGAELQVFQRSLGPSVTVERTQHLLSGACIGFAACRRLVNRGLATIELAQPFAIRARPFQRANPIGRKKELSYDYSAEMVPRKMAVVRDVTKNP